LLQGDKNFVLIADLFYCPPSRNGSGAAGFALLQIKKRGLAKEPLSARLNNHVPHFTKSLEEVKGAGWRLDKIFP
jgi:hypothetical protein